ncbi:unnamed protein product [Cuscuta europaea]|uniref:Myb/SANT-like domain-containing protein n=1 Tax=Cuscuta europaea TaxID=41803 RepID=A0A9P1EAF9_CUSEU|nr:unnamed protein product [Cuscuta europaea]
MGDLQGKEKAVYNAWSTEESSLLLDLLVEAAQRGWRDCSGLITKQTVESKILPVLNEKLGCQKTYKEYQSRWRYFKQRYQKYADLMKFSSGFGWDPITKKFTASDEVWKNYLESHGAHKSLRTDTIHDYEDLQIVVGNVTATGKNSVGLGEESDARTYDVEENTQTSIEDYVYDESQNTYVPTQQDPIHDLTVPPTCANRSPTPSRSSGSKKRTRDQCEGSSKPKSSESRSEFQTKVASGMNSPNAG